MNGLQMDQVEAPLGNTLDDTLRNQFTLGVVELQGFGDAQFVPQHRRARNKIRVAGIHSAASGAAPARM
jgi:hypothetical protein